MNMNILYLKRKKAQQLREILVPLAAKALSDPVLPPIESEWFQMAKNYCHTQDEIRKLTKIKKLRSNCCNNTLLGR